VSFPESHDTERLAAEYGGAPEVARQRYLFAAFFSAGLMMPIGYEYGFKKRLHVVRTRPQDWEPLTYDLSPYIGGVNRMKRRCPALLEEGPMVRVSPSGEPVVLLLKSRERFPGRVLAVINASRQEQRIKLGSLMEPLGPPPKAWQEITPDVVPLKLKPELAAKDLVLGPAGMRLFYNPEGAPLLSQ